MSDSLGRLMTAQRGLVAVWQMRRMRVDRAQIDVLTRQLQHVHRGVYAKDELDELQRRVRGRTRSDTEAAFILLCHDRALKLPLVNHRLNGRETDFHWRRAGLVVEVTASSTTVSDRVQRGPPARPAPPGRRLRGRTRSADHVYDEPDLVAQALLAAAPSLHP